ncbi:glycosyltransferase family 2 protein [Acinetobacter towneri]|uniref:glycosyltransferase family 2 protein n=1 Tax=Acinetobacter towneri TaxID=202956 RepID=UPI001AA00E8C|nr:glycosyltransferase family 2 protein [Acinetobacter towneri]QTD64338.1 glycosyltransferase family 2 protein [Acinetobacter towneri]
MKFSVIMPSYCSEKTICQAIESVINQTYKDWQLIVIDDCSYDQSLLIAQEYAKNDNRINVIKLKKNDGVANARNIGIENAKGDYIAFLDSDDYWHPEKLEKQIYYFENFPEIDVVFSEYYRFNSLGILGNVTVPNRLIEYKDLLKGNCIGNLTGVYKLHKFLDIRQKKVGAEDYLFWLEIFSKPNIKGIGVAQPLAYYRVAESSKSLSSNKFKSAKWTWDIYYKHLALPFYQAVYFFGFYVYKSLKNRL